MLLVVSISKLADDYQLIKIYLSKLFILFRTVGLTSTALCGSNCNASLVPSFPIPGSTFFPLCVVVGRLVLELVVARTSYAIFWYELVSSSSEFKRPTSRARKGFALRSDPLSLQFELCTEATGPSTGSAVKLADLSFPTLREPRMVLVWWSGKLLLTSFSSKISREGPPDHQF